MNFHRTRSEDRADPRATEEPDTSSTPEPQHHETRHPETRHPEPQHPEPQHHETRHPETQRPEPRHPETRRPDTPPDVHQHRPAANTGNRRPDTTAPDEPAAPSAVGTGNAGQGRAAAKGPAAPGPDGTDGPDQLSRRMERAVRGFVDDPRRAVREADVVLDDAIRRLTREVEERRSALRESWHGDNGERTGTEELRLALTRYRDMTRDMVNHIG